MIGFVPVFLTKVIILMGGVQTLDFFLLNPQGELPQLDGCQLRAVHGTLPPAQWQRLLLGGTNASSREKEWLSHSLYTVSSFYGKCRQVAAGPPST